MAPAEWHERENKIGRSALPGPDVTRRGETEKVRVGRFGWRNAQGGLRYADTTSTSTRTLAEGFYGRARLADERGRVDERWLGTALQEAFQRAVGRMYSYGPRPGILTSMMPCKLSGVPGFRPPALFW